MHRPLFDNDADRTRPGKRERDDNGDYEKKPAVL